MIEHTILERILCHPLAPLAAAWSRGPQPHAVGGVVRDAVLAIATDDLDLSVAERGAELARDLAELGDGRAIALGGDRFSSFRVVTATGQADIWDRHGGTLDADLERRDLTINAIACALDGSGLRDPFGGLNDLASKTLRTTKSDCFRRDPLRVLRLARFELTLPGFAVEAATAEAAREAAGGLERTAGERIRAELERILATASAHAAFSALHALGALTALVPAAGPDFGRDLLERARRLDRCGALIRSAQRARSETGETFWSGSDQRLSALALIVPGAGAEAPGDGIAAFETRGLATRKALRNAARLRRAQLPGAEPDDERGRRLFLFEHGRTWPLALAVAAAHLPALEENRAAAIAERLAETASAHPRLVQGLEPLLDGHAVARILGVAPGPEVGAALARLARAQAAGAISTAAEAEAWLLDPAPD